MRRSLIYSTEQLQAWEQRWFDMGNSDYGLMQQAAWQMTAHIIQRLNQIDIVNPIINVWCGTGNNGGDGCLIAAYLKKAGYQTYILHTGASKTASAQQAKQEAMQQQVPIVQAAIELPEATIDIDALFGIGLSRDIHGNHADLIDQLNQRKSIKVAVDIPSGLHGNTGTILGHAVRADLTLTVLGLKAGLLTGQGKAYAGQVQFIDLIPKDDALKALASLDDQKPSLPKRHATGHKGTYGHVLVIGGDENMGGAAIMTAEAALASGAGKVTLLTHEKHHSAALTRCPNMMTLTLPFSGELSIQDVDKLTHGIDVIVIGMGLGRHAWGKKVWQSFLPLLSSDSIQSVVIDADALYHLADETLIQPLLRNEAKQCLPQAQEEGSSRYANWYLTPHSGEAGRLLGITADEVERDRITAIYALKEKYGGSWLLKGAGSLSLDQDGLSICALGNAGMATAGMGDTLAGMAGGLLAQLPELPLHDIVALHAAAGDLLAELGERGLQAPQMLDVIKRVVN
jgi:hydroxyethylthiazole kinase-like uncharacterized protein yjeF